MDPGVRGAGVALGVGQELQHAAYIANPVRKGQHVSACVALARAVADWFVKNSPAGQLPELMLFEWPRAYLAAKQKGDQNDLFPMPGVDCAIAMAFPHLAPDQFVTLFPDEWKHQVPKFVMNKRVWERLSKEERLRVERRDVREPGGEIGLDHNSLDACGLWLHQVDRLERHRVFPG